MRRAAIFFGCVRVCVGGGEGVWVPHTLLELPNTSGNLAATESFSSECKGCQNLGGLISPASSSVFKVLAHVCARRGRPQLLSTRQ